ncbi:MAG: TIR domain-containing protein [Chloroflexota bacterium]|nr:TIR domain-containing protein [Chloroflexota bacterium]
MEPDNAAKKVEVFYSYHPQDEKLRQQLEKHLSILKRNKCINTWFFRKLQPGVDWLQVINAQLNVADIVLLLVSPDFLDSDYCYEVEVRRAIERSESDEAIVIPIILRPVDWAGTPFSCLAPLPAGGKPVTTWKNRESAFYDISLGIQDAAKTVLEKYGIDNSQHHFTPPLQEPQGIFVQHYLYDIVLEFALEDRPYAEDLADSLRYHGLKVFCYSEGTDKEMELALWGKPRYASFFDPHQGRWRYCVLLLSQYYAQKLSHRKREVALVRALQDQGYILPIHLDETTFPDINEDTAFAIKWHKIGSQAIADFLAKKVQEVSRLMPDQ